MDVIEIHQRFGASPEEVFAALSDHARMADWLGAKVTLPMLTEGGGVGTIRRIHVGPMHVDEQIVAHEPPARIVYKIVNSVPGITDHEGEVRIAPHPAGGSEVHWLIHIEWALPRVGALASRTIRFGLSRGLRRLASSL